MTASKLAGHHKRPRRGSHHHSHQEEGTSGSSNGGGRAAVGLLLLAGGYWLGFMHSRAPVQDTMGESAPTTESPVRQSLRQGVRWGESLWVEDGRGSRTGASNEERWNATKLRAELPAWDEVSQGRIPDGFPEYEAECSWPPEPGYPKKVAIKELVANWNPDNVADPPARMYSTLCRFDYTRQADLALKYRDAELPFQVYNVPELNAVSRKWSDDAYLRKRLGARTKYKCEASNPGGEVNHGANHFMYTNGRPTPSKKEPPIKHVRLTWDEWLEKVRTYSNTSVETPDSRFYFRVSAASPNDAQAGWLFQELPFFRPKPSLFIRDPKGQRGIHCRFGMAGVIAEAHWDGSRNTIAQFYGRRRYILVDPDDSCDMYLLAKNHPSGRHSEVDWSKPDTWKDYPRFPDMPAHEVVQRAGDMLYLPTYYLHYIISIDRNYQCNSRSGRDDRQTDVVNRCTPGFQSFGPFGSSGKNKPRKNSFRPRQPNN